MRIIREASQGDAREIEKLINWTLPNDPVIIFLKGTRRSSKFFESLILLNKVIVSIDDHFLRRSRPMELSYLCDWSLSRGIDKYG